MVEQDQSPGGAGAGGVDDGFQAAMTPADAFLVFIRGVLGVVD
jgi:hypothetical protein